MSVAETEQSELLADNLYVPAPAGWGLERASIVQEIPGRSGPGVQLHGVKPGPQMKASAGLRVTSIPVNTELTFSCLLRGSRCGQKVRVNVFAYNCAYHLIMEASSLVPLDHRNWIEFESMYVAPVAAKYLHIWIISFEAQPTYVTEPSLKAGAPMHTTLRQGRDYSTPKDVESTKVVEALYKASVRAGKDGEIGTITFPIPGPYRNQIPLTFNLHAKPKAALLDYEIKKREDGINWIAEVRVKPTGKGVIVSWDSLVLIRGQDSYTAPLICEEKPPDAESWLRSSKCVQSDDDEILAKARKLAKESIDLDSYVRNVIRFTSKNRGEGKRFDSLDAKTALGAGGSCTSRANLAAALLRAHGIPARTVSHLPTWMRSYFFEHWLVEYWHPDFGWTWVEPTLGQMEPAANQIVVLAVSSTDDEDKCDDPFHLRYLFPGGAYLSGCELSKELHAAALMKRFSGPNIAIDQSEIRGTELELDNLFQAALQNFEKIGRQLHVKEQSTQRNEQIRIASYDGEANRLADLLLETDPNSSPK